MTTEIQRKMKQLQDSIFSEKYYTKEYVAALAKYNMSTASIDQDEYSDKQIVKLCNTFWFDLPDTPSIRCATFFALCDIAEHCFDGE